MRYAVEMTPTAESELHGAFRYIHARSPLNAVRWLRKISKIIDSLGDFPTRCGIAPESSYLAETLRQQTFKSHRIIFFIDEPARIVRVLFVRHGKMRAVGETEDEADEC
jgi:plasmid stabilization system protein ParE